MRRRTRAIGSRRRRCSRPDRLRGACRDRSRAAEPTSPASAAVGSARPSGPTSSTPRSTSSTAKGDVLLSECGAYFYGTYSGRRGVGVMFYCPLCVKSGRPEDDRHLIPVNFKIALDGLPVPEDTRRWKEKVNGVEVEKVFTVPQWTRTGDTIDTLTLSPSVNADAQDHG